MISIVTASYNRENLLPRLYESLLKQKNKEFEWIIIDDGSTDDTENLIMKFKSENFIKINYLKKENGGKHTALNIGVEISIFPYIFFLDSDDILPKDSIQVIINKIKYIQLHPYYEKIAGVCGSKASLSGVLVGNSLNKDILCSYMDYRYKYKIRGDKAEIFKKEVLIKYRFPIFEKEKFCPEALVWNRISKEYNMYFFDEIVYFCEYLSGGLTDKILEIRRNSPNATLRYYKELFETDSISYFIRIRALINFWRFYYISDLNNYSGGISSSLLNLLLRPLIKIYMKFLNQ